MSLAVRPAHARPTGGVSRLLTLSFLPEWPTAHSTDDLLAGLAWRVDRTGGRIVRHATDAGTGRVHVVVASDDVDALLRLMASRRIPALAETVVDGRVAVLRDGLSHLVTRSA